MDMNRKENEIWAKIVYRREIKRRGDQNRDGEIE